MIFLWGRLLSHEMQRIFHWDGPIKAEIKSLPAIALAQAMQTGMVLDLPEGHDGYCGDTSSPR
jgi:hypothetical protein